MREGGRGRGQEGGWGRRCSTSIVPWQLDKIGGRVLETHSLAKEIEAPVVNDLANISISTCGAGGSVSIYRLSTYVLKFGLSHYLASHPTLSKKKSCGPLSKKAADAYYC